MTELDRRAFVTGLAAVAAAGVTPALPAAAAPLVRSGVIFEPPHPYKFERPRSELILKTAFFSRWQIHSFGEGEHTIRHCRSGLTFAHALRDFLAVELVCAADALPLPFDAATLDRIGHAARMTSSANCGAWRTTPFFLSFDPDRLEEDAPPLPRFA